MDPAIQLLIAEQKVRESLENEIIRLEGRLEKADAKIHAFELDLTTVRHDLLVSEDSCRELSDDFEETKSEFVFDQDEALNIAEDLQKDLNHLREDRNNEIGQLEDSLCEALTALAESKAELTKKNYWISCMEAAGIDNSEAYSYGMQEFLERYPDA